MRVLATLAAGIHVDYAALLMLTPTGSELVAAHNIRDPASLTTHREEGPDTPRWTMSKSLEDEDGPIGMLMLGPRSDGNRYNRGEREALDEVLTPLAEALRFSRRKAHTNRMQAFEARLAQLEGFAVPKPT